MFSMRRPYKNISMGIDMKDWKQEPSYLYNYVYGSTSGAEAGESQVPLGQLSSLSLYLKKGIGDRAQ